MPAGAKCTPGVHLPHDGASLRSRVRLQLLAKPPEACAARMLPKLCQDLLRMHICVLPLTTRLLRQHTHTHIKNSPELWFFFENLPSRGVVM